MKIILKTGIIALLPAILAGAAFCSPDFNFSEEIGFTRVKKVVDRDETVFLPAGSEISIGLGAGTVTLDTHKKKEASIHMETWLSNDVTPEEEGEIIEKSRVTVKKTSRKNLEITCENYEEDDDVEDIENIDAVIDITILIPADAGCEIELGLGKVICKGAGGEIEVELGVGHAMVEGCENDTDVEVGVGVAELTLGKKHGEVDMEMGVGKIVLTTDGAVPGNYSADVGIGVFHKEGDGDKETDVAIGGTREWTVGEGGAGVDLEVGMGKIVIKD